MINQLRRILEILPTLEQALEQASADLLKNLCSVRKPKTFEEIRVKAPDVDPDG
jgi:hypothetical protein